MRNRILSLLVLLLTAASGSWAQSTGTFTDLKNEIGSGGNVTLGRDYYKYKDGDGDPIEISTSGVINGNGAVIDMEGATISPVFKIYADNVTIKNLTIKNYTGTGEAIQFEGTGGSLVNVVYEVAISPGSTANTWTLSMPGSNLLLTPIYSAATVYQADGVTEKKAYASLKEAFAAVQSGDVIKLDWNVDVNGQALTTPSTGDGLKFTLDFNGYTIKNQDREDLVTLTLHNSGDEITFIDSSDGQTGGYKGITNFENGSRIIIAGGRYNLNDQNAETLNQDCLAEGHFDLAPGMQFVDLEGGATANNGFIVRATYKDIELTIGPKRFATFYAATNFKLAAGTPEGVGIYTITNVNNDRTTATATSLGSVIASCTPMLVYNGTDAQQTMTLQASTEPATATTVKPIDEFKGTFVDRTFTDTDMAAADYYALSGGKAFAPVKGTGTLGANKCWLQFDKQQTGNAPVSLMIVFEGEDLTEVNEVIGVNEVSDDTIYDLSGRKVGSTLKKGVYIKNGQKVVK